MYDHVASKHGGSVLLGFKKGDVMTLVRKRHDGWCKVTKGSEQGWAPTSYLKPLPQQQPSTEQAAESESAVARPTSPQRRASSDAPLPQPSAAMQDAGEHLVSASTCCLCDRRHGGGGR